MKKFLLLFLGFIGLNLSTSQSFKSFYIPDSLKRKSFEYLINGFASTRKSDLNKAELYANCLVAKAKEGKNYYRTSDGYSFLYEITADPAYLDSMILVSKKNQNFDNIALGYLYKGNYYYSKSDYSKSLENYLSARAFSKKNLATYNIITFNIGLLKLELGNYQESLELFLNYQNYLDNNDKSNKLDYVSCMYAIAYTYSKMNKLDLSDSYVKLGLDKIKKTENQENFSNLLLVSGINQYKRKNYNQAVTNLRKVSTQIKNNSYNVQNLALSEFYRGMSQYENGDANFVETFKGLDSIIISTRNVTSELRDFYPILIEYYKRADDKENQLFYIEHLLIVDQILHKNSSVLTAEINKKYDTPILLQEKERLITELDSKNYILELTTFIILAVLGFLLFLYIKSRKKIKFYKTQAYLLSKTAEINSASDQQPIKNDVRNKTEKSKITFSSEKLKILDLKFKEFETEKKFLQKNITLDNLAKEFETNRDYLSKSVNELKGKNFSQYINELRIQYIIQELKTNANLQKFSIAGIAEEAGYNNSESFTNAFKKMTDTLPSYYIKALEISKKNSLSSSQ